MPLRGKTAIACLLAWTVTESLLLAPTQVEAAPRPQPSGICTKVGATTRIGTAVYKCKRVQNQLRWRLIQKAPKATSTTVSTVLDPYAKYGEYSWLYKSIDSYASSWSRSMPSQSISTLLTSESPYDGTTKLFRIGAELSGRLMYLFSDFVPEQRIYVYDSDVWLKEQLSAYCPSLADWLVTANSRGAAGCGNVFAFKARVYRRLPDKVTIGDAAHELFHNVQAARRGLTSSAGRLPVVPAWFREGSSQMARGLIYAIYENPDSPRYSSFFLDEESHSQQLCGSVLTRWIEIDESLGGAIMNQCEYGLGTLMVELLTAKSGTLESVLQVYDKIGTGTSFRAALSHTYNYSFEELLQDLKLRLNSYGWTI